MGEKYLVTDQDETVKYIVTADSPQEAADDANLEDHFVFVYPLPERDVFERRWALNSRSRNDV